MVILTVSLAAFQINCKELKKVWYNYHIKLTLGQKRRNFVKLFEIDESSGVPIWLQVKNGLLHLIMSGYFKPGNQMPSVRQLAVSLSINYNTVNKVYLDMEREGYIKSKRGRGTFVADVIWDEEAAHELVDDLADVFINKALSVGLCSDKILEIVQAKIKKYIPAKGEDFHGSGN